MVGTPRCSDGIRARRAPTLLGPLSLALLLLGSSLLFVPTPAEASTSHDPIQIDGDADFADQASSEGWPGSGTAGDPYIIEGHTISARSENGIDIQNTRVHFILRDHVITGAGGSTYGIYLSNVQYGTVENVTVRSVLIGVFFNIVADSEVRDTRSISTIYGVAIISSFRNTFDDVTIEDARFGFYLLHSHENRLTDNSVHDTTKNSIYIHNGHSNRFTRTLIENATEKAVHLLDTSGNRISGTTIRGTPLAVHVEKNGANRIDNSTIDGVPKGLLVDGVHDTVFVDNDIVGATAGIDLQSAKRVRLDGNTIRNGSLGLNLYFTESAHGDGLTFRNLTTGVLGFSAVLTRLEGVALHANGIGIYLKSSRLTTLETVDASENGQAVRLESARDTVIDGATFSANTYGVTLAQGLKAEIRHSVFTGNDIGLRIQRSDANTIWDNRFENLRNVEIIGEVQQTWNIEKTRGQNIIGGGYLGGNHWHDYRGMDADQDGLGEIPHSLFPYGRAGSEPLADATGFAYGPEDALPLVALSLNA